jgi:DNA-binding transcriptional regulator YhcF (GntR family)
MQKIFKIDDERRTPKYLQLMHCITKAIKNGTLKTNDRIPSINELSNEFLMSRQTVQKAYSLLIETGIVVPIQGKGYYINRTDISTPYRLLLILNKISNYKKQVYNAMIHTLNGKAIVEIKVHHSNTALLDEFITGHEKEFDYILIMPHFYENQAKAVDIIRKIPGEKLILLDKDLPELPNTFISIYQDFKNDIIEALESSLESLRRYQQLILIFPKLTQYPQEIETGFQIYCRQNQFPCKVISEFNLDSVLEKHSAYIVIEETDLVNLVKTIRSSQMTVGKDIGIISFNETPLKEILLDGIAVISTDHEQMGTMAAEMILTNKKGKVKNPFRLIPRNSL